LELDKASKGKGGHRRAQVTGERPALGKRQWRSASRVRERGFHWVATKGP
jgi:hypothetical protein